jgi:undecaprenyl phosphate-alpha-L-ara4FN deformylase
VIIKSSEANILGLKVDVDTHVGMKRGVPRLLDILRNFNVRGTFFLSMGPDSSGRAVFQLVKNPLFLKKMMRTGAGRLYGWRTALYGTLLPSPMIALSFPNLVQDIISEGHDVEFHAWDHRRWQDELPACPCGWIEDWFKRGVEAYRKIAGREPSSFGAPAWLIDERALEIAAKYPFQYLSCTRAREPFVHDIPGLLEIPSDLPCFEEIGVDEGVARILRILEDGQTHILPVHAEAEGGIWDRYFEELLKGALQMHYRVLPLSEIREILRHSTWPVRRHRMELLPGRSAPCAV